MDAAQIVKDALTDNEEIRIVLEIAARARELDRTEPLPEMNISTDVIPTNFQVSLATLG